MSDIKVYPAATAPKSEPAVDEAELARDMLAVIEAGATKAYADRSIGIREGDPLPWTHVKAIAMAGRDIPLTAERIRREIIAEAVAMRKVNPGGYDTETAYKAALTAVKKHLDVTKWVAGIKDEYGVSTWAELKNATKATAEL